MEARKSTNIKVGICAMSKKVCVDKTIEKSSRTYCFSRKTND